MSIGLRNRSSKFCGNKSQRTSRYYSRKFRKYYKLYKNSKRDLNRNKVKQNFSDISQGTYQRSLFKSCNFHR